MEVSRLLTALYVLWNDFDKLQIVTKLVTLSNSLQNLVNAPTDAATSVTFTKSVNDLKHALNHAESNSAVGSIRLALVDAGLESMIPINILAKLNEILDASPFLPPQAAQALQGLITSVRSQQTLLDSAITSLQNLNFRAETVSVDTYEIGILMPSRVMKDDLRVIEREFEEWVFVINHVQELVDGQPAATIPVHSISSGSLDLYCGFHATGAEAMIILSAGAYTVLQFVRDAQKRRREMEGLRYPDSVIKPMIEHENGLIDQGKEEIVEKLMSKKSARLAENRDSELKTALRRVVAFVLKRLNDGVDVGVSTPPEAAENVASANQEVSELRANIEQMRLDMTRIVASLPDRSTPLLQLPEPSTEETAPSTPVEKSASKPAKASRPK